MVGVETISIGDRLGVRQPRLGKDTPYDRPVDGSVRLSGGRNGGLRDRSRSAHIRRQAGCRLVDPVIHRSSSRLFLGWNDARALSHLSRLADDLCARNPQPPQRC